MVRAVLDANIFVSAAIRPEGPPGRLLRRFLADQAFELVISPSIEAEIVAALRYPSVRKCLRSPIDPGRWVEAIMLLADIVEDTVLPSPVSQDPDDDKYLAAALIGRATVVVSGDRHLLSFGQYEGIRVMSPKTFLDLLDRA